MSSDLFSPSWSKRKVAQKPTFPRGTKEWKVVDLFCGCGGLSLGSIEMLNSFGIPARITTALDFSEDALIAYKYNFASIAENLLCEDISKLLPGYPGTPFELTEKAFISRLPQTDLFLAGPPCQGNSDLNNHTRRADPRNLLYLKAIRFIEVARPRIFVIENVPPVLKDRHGVVDFSIAFLEERLHYSTRSVVLDSYKLGLPQRRKRHFLLGSLKYSLKNMDLIFSSSCQANLREYIGDLIDESPSSKDDIFRSPPKIAPINRRRIDYLFDNNIFELPDEERPPCHRDKNHSYLSMYGRLAWEKPAQTITSGFGSMGQGRYVHPEKRRLITPHEAARIQGFPDFYDFSMIHKRSILQEIIANAVPPIMAGRVVESILLMDGDENDETNHS